MSYRELRAITEYLRILSYPLPVSIDNFRKPNFPLIADILVWILSRLDPDADIPKRIETEANRVQFIREVAQHLATKLNIRLNTKKLYSADGLAVQELLKAISLIHEASKSVGIIDEDTELLSESIIRAKLTEFKRTHQITSSITTKGANLFDELTKEIMLREHRSYILTRPLNLSDVEAGLKEAITSLQYDMQHVRQNIENIASDEASLENKIKRKAEELDRAKKRLDALKAVRPAFMDEYEKLEQELTVVYDEYILKHRCLMYLEQQLEEFERTEIAQVKRREENMRGMISTAIESNVDETDEQVETQEEDSKKATGRLVSGRITSHDRKVAREDSLDSDIDLGDGDEEEASDLDSEDELELMKLSKTKAEAVKDDDKNSDDDF